MIILTLCCRVLSLSLQSNVKVVGEWSVSRMESWPPHAKTPRRVTNADAMTGAIVLSLKPDHRYSINPFPWEGTWDLKRNILTLHPKEYHLALEILNGHHDRKHPVIHPFTMSISPDGKTLCWKHAMADRVTILFTYFAKTTK